MVEFLNNWNLDPEHNILKVMLGDEHRLIDKHVLVEVKKKFHTREIKADHAEMFDARVILGDIANRVLDTYNSNEG